MNKKKFEKVVEYDGPDRSTFCGLFIMLIIFCFFLFYHCLLGIVYIFISMLILIIMDYLLFREEYYKEIKE